MPNSNSETIPNQSIDSDGKNPEGKFIPQSSSKPNSSKGKKRDAKDPNKP